MRPRPDSAVGRRHMPDRAGVHHVRGVHVHDAGKQRPGRRSTTDPEQPATATAAAPAPATAATARPAAPAAAPVAAPVTAGAERQAQGPDC